MKKGLALLESMHSKNQKFKYPSNTKARDSLMGFTLVEVLVSVAIIVALVSVIMFAPRDARQKAALLRASAEADQIATGAFLYYQDTGNWPTDVGNGLNADFYNIKYVPVTGTMVQDYLGADYYWDWQNWGKDDSGPNGTVFSDQPADPFMCWQSVHLYRGTNPSARLMARKCIRDVCFNQKYCNQNGDCWNTAANRDAGTVNGVTNSGSTGFIEYYKTPNPELSAVCENCSTEAGCEEKFQPQ